MIESFNNNWEVCKGTSTINSIFSADFELWSNNATVAAILDEQCQKVNVPHTWNDKDGQDGGNNYYRGIYWYSKTFDSLELKSEEEAYIEFEGVNSIAEAYINGNLVTRHEGGFSTFRANITKFLEKKNTLIVKVDNGANESVYPQHADFTFFGGIYRNVNLVVVNKTHFDLDNNGGSGISLTPVIENKKRKHGKCRVKDSTEAETTTITREGRVKVKCDVTNYNGEVIEIKIKDKKGEVVLKERHTKLEFTTGPIADLHLWEGIKNPYLYSAEISILQNLEVVDTKTINIGFRTFKVDPEEGFYLNGEKYPLRGVSRHQDRKDVGWALSEEDQDSDMALIKEIGANTVRLAHYQHSQYFYDLCDKEGLIVWAEIPYITNQLTDGHKNVLQQMEELVVQNYNHPSIAIWGISNEITTGGIKDNLIEKNKEVNDLAKSIDSTRLTAIADASGLDISNELNNITDVVGYNHYFGWYGNEVEDNGPWLDNFHEKYPNRPIGLSEYGAESVTTWHSENPKKGDYTEEYQAYYHEQMLKTFETRPYLWATYVWNMFDFAADNRDEGGVKGTNNKGLVLHDHKTKKDSFYVYKAYWSEEPMVHIASKRFVKRAKETITVKVYSNQPVVKLYVNGELLKELKGDKVFEFSVPMSKTTEVKAVAGSVSDSATFEKVDKECDDYILKDAGEIKNWYDAEGNVIEMTFNEGYWSIRDKVSEIKQHEIAGPILQELLEDMVKQLGELGMQLPPNVITMMNPYTVEQAFELLCSKLSPSVLENINIELQKISKE